MVKIEEDTKLDFSDVLIKPKRSTISSRSQVELSRTFKTLHSNKEWSGVLNGCKYGFNWYISNGIRMSKT